MKKIAVIGSSGGNLRSQGGADPQKMMAEIFAQAKAAGIEVSAIQFILTEGSMDKISMDMAAALFSLDEVGQLISGKQQKLSEINEQAKMTDQQLAQRILNGEIDGLMLLSCDPKGVNNQNLCRLCSIVCTTSAIIKKLCGLSGNVCTTLPFNR